MYELPIRFFKGPPAPKELRSGEAGVNACWLNDLLANRPPKNVYWERILVAVFQCPNEDGTVPPNQRIAEFLGLSRDTIARTKTRFEEMGLIYRVNLNGGFGYNPDLLVVKDKKGAIIRHPSIRTPVLAIDSPGTNLLSHKV